ncbi:unnamed protein product [Clonostachys rosea f. rosea IK726]|uniref:Uncharacterized protein n=1 Tax=Clonostachys rosea f. rosea IK726 TaxID=1349383 RepID=A0ACA9UC63_BIOOC|nr:unnamed protein product [Clonostachys rosea f. rosea IK726]
MPPVAWTFDLWHFRGRSDIRSLSLLLIHAHCDQIRPRKEKQGCMRHTEIATVATEVQKGHIHGIIANSPSIFCSVN